MSGTEGLDRRTQILDAAEEAFATLGYAGASLRQIAASAGANLASAHYYFGSKEGLFKAVLERRLEPLRKRHLELLHNAAAESPGQPLAVEKILEAIVLPPLVHAAQAGPQRSPAQRLIGRIVAEPDAACQQLVAQMFSEMQAEFMAAFKASLPEALEPELYWRLEFVWGAIGFILCSPGRLEAASQGTCTLADPVAAARHMLDFFAAGFRPLRDRQAPAPAPLHPAGGARAEGLNNSAVHMMNTETIL